MSMFSPETKTEPLPPGRYKYSSEYVFSRSILRFRLLFAEFIDPQEKLVAITISPAIRGANTVGLNVPPENVASCFGFNRTNP